MRLMSWAEEKIHNLTIWDFAVVKIVLILFGMVIGAYISTFVKQYLWYFIILFVTLYIIIICGVFKKRKEKEEKVYKELKVPKPSRT